MTEAFVIPPPPSDDATPRRSAMAISADVDKAPCPDCGRPFNVNQDGTIRRHNCPGHIVIEAERVPGQRRTRKVGGRKPAPAKVRRLGSAFIASGVEWGAQQTFSRAIPCAPADVPADVPDAEKMIGPFIDLLWPQIPVGAQKVIVNLAEQEDLIVAALAWLEWYRTLAAWARTESDRRASPRVAQPVQPNLSVVPNAQVVPIIQTPVAQNTMQTPIPPEGLSPDVFAKAPEPFVGTFEPFSPADTPSAAVQ